MRNKDERRALTRKAVKKQINIRKMHASDDAEQQLILEEPHRYAKAHAMSLDSEHLVTHKNPRRKQLHLKDRYTKQELQALDIQKADNVLA